MIGNRLPDILTWNRWANAQVVAVLFGTGGEPRNALAAIQHIFETEVVWMRRIEGDTRPMIPLWAPPSLSTVSELGGEAQERIGRLIELAANPEFAEGVFKYRNSTGTEFEGSVADALTQMLMHSSQYRGEASGFLNGAGFKVPDVDYIFWQRLGKPA